MVADTYVSAFFRQCCPSQSTFCVTCVHSADSVITALVNDIHELLVNHNYAVTEDFL